MRSDLQHLVSFLTRVKTRKLFAWSASFLRMSCALSPSHFEAVVKHPNDSMQALLSLTSMEEDTEAQCG